MGRITMFKWLARLFNKNTARDRYKEHETELLRKRLAAKVEMYEEDDTTLNEFNRIWNEGVHHEMTHEGTRTKEKDKNILPHIDVTSFDEDETVPPEIWDYIEVHRNDAYNNERRGRKANDNKPYEPADIWTHIEKHRQGHNPHKK